MSLKLYEELESKWGGALGIFTSPRAFIEGENVHHYKLEGRLEPIMEVTVRRVKTGTLLRSVLRQQAIFEGGGS